MPFILDSYNTEINIWQATSSSENNISKIHQKKLTVIIPAYNEENRILPVLNEVCSFISNFNLSWEVVVSIDGNDGTEELTKGMMVKFPFLSYSKGAGRSGKGGAIKRVLSFSKGEYIILMDADGSISFSEIIKHLDLLEKYDVINFDRYKRKGNKIPKLRRFVSRGYNLYIRVLFKLDINDTQCGYKIISASKAKEVFSNLTVTNGFFYSPLFVYLKRMGINTVEVSVNYQHSDGSKFSVGSMILGGFISALAYRVRFSPLWKYVPNRLVELFYRKFRWI